MKVEVIRAWPRRCERFELDLPAGSCVAEAVAAAGLDDEIAADAAYAVFGVRVDGRTPLNEGDRVEVLRPLQIDPMDARRRRAQAGRAPR